MCWPRTHQIWILSILNALNMCSKSSTSRFVYNLYTIICTVKVITNAINPRNKLLPKSSIQHISQIIAINYLFQPLDSPIVKNSASWKCVSSATQHQLTHHGIVSSCWSFVMDDECTNVTCDILTMTTSVYGMRIILYTMCVYASFSVNILCAFIKVLLFIQNGCKMGKKIEISI